MGGRNLGAASTGLKDGEASDDDIKVISDNGSSNGSKAFAGQNFPGRLGGAGMSITPLGGQGSRYGVVGPLQSWMIGSCFRHYATAMLFRCLPT